MMREGSDGRGGGDLKVWSGGVTRVKSMDGDEEWRKEKRMWRWWRRWWRR